MNDFGRIGFLLYHTATNRVVKKTVNSALRQEWMSAHLTLFPCVHFFSVQGVTDYTDYHPCGNHPPGRPPHW